MRDSMKKVGKGSSVSSFSLRVHAPSKQTSSFTAPSQHTAVNTQWLVETSSEASKLTAQRSNVELLCILTCLNKARALQKTGKDGPSDGNADWIANIEQWCSKNTTLAQQSAALCAYFDKYDFSLYQNVSTQRSAISYITPTFRPRHVLPFLFCCCCGILTCNK
jgi:hypothetical protein